MLNNSTFHGSGPTWANACVGDNGNPTYVDYAKGYSEAANLLIVEIIKHRGLKQSVDSFIYPICFNMRHSVELWLKGTVVKLQALAKIKGSHLDFDLSGSHDIGNIWGFIKTNAIALDKRYSPFIKKLDSYIQDIADVDATGQTFRYPIDSDSKKHLTEISLINVLVLRDKFGELESILDDFNYFNDFIEDEYRQGSFTSNLSRAELFSLANELPPRMTWADIDFKSIKKEAMKKYDLSSNELCKAISVIENNYEMGRLMSVLPPLKGVSLKELHVFFDQWVKLHGIDRLKGSPGNIRSENTLDVVLAHMKEDSKIEAECCDVLLKELSVESVSGLTALFYFASYKDFSEYYVRMYEMELSTLGNKSSDYRGSINHLINKTNALGDILISLYFLGYSDYADIIIKKYDLDGCFEWLDKAINRDLFLKPEIFGYEIQ